MIAEKKCQYHKLLSEHGWIGMHTNRSLQGKGKQKCSCTCNLADEMESVNFAQGPVCQVYFHPFKYFAALLMDSDVPSSENQLLNS